MNNIGVIIARFQSPYLHPAHCALIEQVQAKHNRVVVVLGVAPIMGSRRNPYDYPTREKMVKAKYPEIVVLPHADHPDDDTWSIRLDALLRSTFPSMPFVLYGGRDSFIPYYSGNLTTVELPQEGDHNATDIRAEYASRALDSEDFRAGIVYAYHNQYPTAFTTVDIAVFRKDRAEILLGRKPDEAQWCLPGGFVDPTDDTMEGAALRELHEECGPIEVGALQYAASQRVNDWRYRNEVNQIITLVYTCDWMFGEPKASDDLAELQWVPVEDLPKWQASAILVPGHARLLELIIPKLQTA